MLSEDSADRVARRLHKRHMGHRYIEIFVVNTTYVILRNSTLGEKVGEEKSIVFLLDMLYVSNV